MALTGMTLNGVEGALVPLELLERTKAAIQRVNAMRAERETLQTRIANQRRDIAAKEEALSRVKKEAADASRLLQRVLNAMTDEEWQAVAERIFGAFFTTEQRAEVERAAEKAALADRVLAEQGDECDCEFCRPTIVFGDIRDLL